MKLSKNLSTRQLSRPLKGQYSRMGRMAGVFADYQNAKFIGAKRVFNRNSPATRVNASLAYESVAANALRFSYDKVSGLPLGGLFEDTAQNLVRNAVFAGLVAGTIGAGGSYPTNWHVTNSIATPPIDVSPITINGQPGMRLHMYGIAPVSGGYFLQFDTTTGIVVAPGDVLETQMDLAMVAGSRTGISSISTGYIERNSVGTFASFNETAIYGSTFLDDYHQRVRSKPTAVATGVRSCPFLKFSIVSGAAVDITIDISEVGHFKLPQPTTSVYSSGTSAIRAADDESFPLPGWSTATYLFAGESRLGSDGRTIGHLVDGSNNGLRFYRSGYVIYGVTSVAGVEGVPVALGKTIPGTPFKIKATVAGAVVNASMNGKPSVSLSATDGVPYTFVYVGQKSDKSNQWNGTLSLFQAEPGIVNRSSIVTGFFDDFDRANGAIGISPNGQPWQQVPTNGAQIVLSTIVGGKLVAPDSGTTPTASYNGVDMGAGKTIKKMRSLISWGAGGAGGSITLIANANGLATVQNITDNSIHIVWTISGVDIGFWQAGAYNKTNVPYLSSMATDGTQYQIGWETDGPWGLITVPDDNRVFAVKDTRFTTLGGRYGNFEHYWGDSTMDRPVIEAAYAYAA